jgi:DNA-binding MarR family transcriptional regulator
MEHYTPDSFAQQRTVAFFLNQARNIMVMEMDAALKDLGITGQQLGLMAAMKRDRACTPFELSKLLGIDTGAMTRLLDKLEEKGCVVRSRSLEDRRVVNLSITAKGEQVLEQAYILGPNVLNARLQDFSVDEFVEFDRLLKKFVGV